MQIISKSRLQKHTIKQWPQPPPPQKKTEIFYFQAVNKGGEIYLFWAVHWWSTNKV